MSVALIDYGAGNLHSVANALKAAGCADLSITADPSKPIDKGWPTATSTAN